MDDQNQDPKQALIDKLQQSTNILVTVSSNPSVDQLAACLGLTLWLNKIGKHATAVFSGQVPSTLEFLQPEATLEKNTDSLRDFIISLDKSKADKLRYKVEDKVVKIFITPYRTSLTADDLEFSQGDFNVDMVVALGVSAQQDLDVAITAHGRILHDAVVATVTTANNSELGSVNWHDSQASSLSELIVDLCNTIDRSQLDGQIATALLTGVVAETARFSNEKTTPQTMSVSAELMSAGANQQLVASKLDEPKPEPAPVVAEAAPEKPAEVVPEAPPKPDDGTIEITHDRPEDEPAAPAEEPASVPEAAFEGPEVVEEQPEQPEQPALTEADENPEIADAKPGTQSDDEADEQPTAESEAPEAPTEALAAPSESRGSRRVTGPPMLGGTLTANSRPDDAVLDPSSDPLTLASTAPQQPLLDRTNTDAVPDFVPPQNDDQLQPAPPSWMPPQPWMSQAPNPVGQPTAEPEAPVEADALPLPTPPADQAPAEDAPAFQLPPIEPTDTLDEIEHAVDSPHLDQPDQPDVNSARDEVMRAINSIPDVNPEPIQALNAQPISLDGAQPPEAPMPPAPDNFAAVPAPAPQSTAFDPAAFNTMNDTDFSGLPAGNNPLSDAQPAPDPELTTPVEQPFTMPLPQAAAPPAFNPVPAASTVTDPNAPPPVPPPLMPPGFPPAQ